MKVIFFGTPQFAVPTLESLLQHPDFEVIAIVTQPDKRRGRGNKMMPSAVKKVALEHNLPVWQPKRIKKDSETLTNLREANVDAFVVVAYGQILSEEILAMPKLGSINVHGSILPKYRGAAPIQWSIYHGDTKTGVTTMLMDKGMDTGDILLKAYTPIGLLDNAHQVAAKLSLQGADLLIETLKKLEKRTIKPIPQDNDRATYAHLIQKEDYIIDWSRRAIALHNQVRGFYPNCYTTFRDRQLKIMATIPLEESYIEQLSSELPELKQQWQSSSLKTGKIGAIVGIIKNFGVVVQTGEGLLLLTEVQLAGKKPQSGTDFVNGMRIEIGETFDS